MIIVIIAEGVPLSVDGISNMTPPTYLVLVGQIQFSIARNHMPENFLVRKSMQGTASFTAVS